LANFTDQSEEEEDSDGGQDAQSGEEAGRTDGAESGSSTASEDELSTAGPLQDLLERAQNDIGNGVRTARSEGIKLKLNFISVNLKKIGNERADRE
jgi:cobalamin biosynthesis protein CobT